LRPAHWYYGQGKASDLHPVNPVRMLKRCFRSNGEHLGAKCHKRSNAVTHNHSSVVLQELQSNKDIKKYNMDLGIGVIESVSNKKNAQDVGLLGTMQHHVMYHQLKIIKAKIRCLTDHHWNQVNI
jgi:hypothetical protein